MKFGPVPIGDAAGAIAAHSIRLDSGMIRKGQRLTKVDIHRLAAEAIGTIVVARLEPGDVSEDDAARSIATALAGPNLRIDPPFTGRANLYAENAGVFLVDKAAVDTLNRIDPAITLATLPQFAAIAAGQMVATVKIIPYAVPGAALDSALAALAAPAVSVAPFRPAKIGLIQTRTSGTKDSVLDKTARVLADRLDPAGATIIAERRIGHDIAAVAEAMQDLAAAGADMLIAFGASAVADRDDVIPAAIEVAGGVVEHFGMPVDPGNLLLIGRIGQVRVIGAPGCARSPKENGFDWVLTRYLAGLDITPDEIMGMGVGGLLMEIATRPQPREGGETVAGHRRRIAAVILAGGRSRRMGGPNKLTATIDGIPIVRMVAEAARQSLAKSVIVVTGDRAEAVEAALNGLDAQIVYNPDFTDGLATSLKCGIAAVPADAEAAIVLLGDMPKVSTAAIDRLIAAYDPDAGAVIVVPTYKAKRGNPVLWDRRYFEALKAINGDTGARHLIGENRDGVVEIELDEGVAIDVDTEAALRRLGGEFAPGEKPG